MASDFRDLHPTLEEGDVKSAPMGVTGADVQLSPAAKKLIPFDVECKAHASFAVYKIMEQARQHGDRIPLVVLKGDRKKPLAVIEWDNFLDLLRK